MTFDPTYFTALYNFIQDPENLDRSFALLDLTETPDKFIYHIKYYIDTDARIRPDGSKSKTMVEFSNDYKRLFIKDLEYKFKIDRLPPYVFEPNELPPRVDPNKIPEMTEAKTIKKVKQKQQALFQ